MRRFFLFAALFLVFTNLNFAQDIATKKQSLPEFRNASLWTGRTGLTLFSDDGKYIAVSGKTADVIIYEAETGNQVSKIDSRGFWAFSFSPDSKYAVTQSSEVLGTTIYEVSTGKKVRGIEGMDGLAALGRALGFSGAMNLLNGVGPQIPLEMGRVPVSPDWKSILVNQNDKEFSVYDFETGKLKYELHHDKYSATWTFTKLLFAPSFAGSASNVIYSPDGKYLIIANGNKNPTLWDAETGKLLNKFESKSRIFFVRFSPDGKYLATSDYDGFARIWETESGKEISSFGAEKEPRVVLMWSNDSQKVISVAPRKGDVKAFDAQTGKEVLTFEKSASDGLIHSKNGTYIITVPRKDKSIYFQIWESGTGKLLGSAPRTKDRKCVFSLKWSPDERYIVTTSGLKDEAEIWNLKGELIQTLPKTTFPMEFSKDGKYLVTGGKTNNPKEDAAIVWEIKQ